MNKILCSAIALVISVSALADESGFHKAKALYDNKLYVQAMDLLQSLPQYGSDAIVDGYVVLCAQKSRIDGYTKLMDAYYRRYSSCSLCTDIRREQAFDLFDREDYAGALALFDILTVKDYDKKQLGEYHFKKGYCHYMLGNDDEALSQFSEARGLMANDYTAPSEYVSGYINYRRAEFTAALDFFERSVRDERFEQISNYYIINCHFELSDYDFVIGRGVDMLNNDKTPADRKAHLARIISESYLVKGDKEKARLFYEDSHEDEASDELKSRADYFYAGSLMYVTGDYQKAVENFGRMADKSDSLGQVAWYQTAFSYMGLKNRVSALDAFGQAAALQYDPVITEDALFNHAKLAFDLNGDTRPFGEYMLTYSDRVRGEKIYTYMALAALANKDYQGAIDAYDRLDVLEGQEKNNYVHANYLRGVELLRNGSYRKAVPCFQAVTYYSDKNEVVNQLARYGLAEAYYRNARYTDAAAQYSSLYNNSALYGMSEGERLAYDVAYSYLKAEDYQNASRWFSRYVSEGGKTFIKDAVLRKADTYYAVKDYAAAEAGYKEYLDKYYEVNDIYPYYQAAMCCGLTIDTKKKKEAQTKMNTKLELLSRVRGADASSKFYAEAMLELGRTYSEQKKNDTALEVFRELEAKAVDAYSGARATLEIGTLKRNVRDIDGALNAYKSVVNKVGAGALADDALLAIESIYQSQNNPQKYLDYLESVGRGSIKTDEQKEEMYYTAAEQLFFSDDCAGAVSAFAQFAQNYPESGRMPAVWYYTGESHRTLGDKEQACDAYEKVLGYPQGDYTVNALTRLSALRYSMDEFQQAYEAYTKLSALLEEGSQQKCNAVVGAMRSAYKSKDYESALGLCDAVLASEGTLSVPAGETRMAKAKSLLSLSRRDEAYEVLATLAANPSTAEGAEAACMVIQDCYEKGDFDAVKTKVYALSDADGVSTLQLAKAFVILGDSFAEEGNLKQAEATFKSILDGYSDNKEITEELQMRLRKLEEMK